MTVWQAIILLFFVMDGVGNIPLYVAALKSVPTKRRLLVAARELTIALGVLVAFLFGGPQLLALLGISQPALTIGGAIVLFLIAIRMVFPPEREVKAGEMEGEPFIVPLAIPLIAGPSAIATVLFMVAQDPSKKLVWLGAIFAAWAATAAIVLGGTAISERLGPRALIAVERLMGMLLVALSVEMTMKGVEAYLAAMDAG